MTGKQAQAVIVQGIWLSKAIADLAIKYRLPSASMVPAYTRAGGLMSYGADVPHLFRRSAVLVQKILQGTKPAGSARRASHQIRSCRQYQDRKGDGPHDLGIVPGTRRRGDRIEMRITAVHESAIALLSRAFPAAGPELAKADIGAPKAHTTMKQGTKNNLTRQGVLRALRRNDELLQKHAVRRIALFGSYASGRQTRKGSRFSGRVQAANLQQLSASRTIWSGCSAGKQTFFMVLSRNEEMAAFTSRIK